MKIKLFSPLLLLSVVAAFNLILFPELYLSCVTEGLNLWFTAVLPALFPFFFLSSLILSFEETKKFSQLFSPLTKKAMGCSGPAAYVFLCSLVSGYPVGAKLICEMRTKQMITASEADRMSTFCSTSGPLFIFGAVATGMFGKKSIGVAIYISHILSCIISGIIFRKHESKEKAEFVSVLQTEKKQTLLKMVSSAAFSCITAGAFIALAFVFCKMLSVMKIIPFLAAILNFILTPFSPENGMADAVANGLIESTRGCYLLSSFGITPLTLSLLSAIISFGGLSVNLQASAYLSECRADIKLYFLSKILQSVIAFLICFIITFCL